MRGVLIVLGSLLAVVGGAAAREVPRFWVQVTSAAARGGADPYYSYTPIGKRDPFRSYLDLTRRPPPDLRCGPLCRLDLSQLKLVAIVYGITTPRALLEAPSGAGFIVRAGQPLGRHGGRIHAIDRRGVVVRETARDALGRAVTSDTVLSLQIAAEASPR